MYGDMFKESQISKFKMQNIMLKKNNDQDNRAIVVMDDCISSSSFFKDLNYKTMMLNGRCFNLSSILTVQFPFGIPPEIRINMDYIFIFGYDDKQTRKRIYDQYAGFFPTFTIFNEIFQEITSSPYRCMVINNTDTSSNIENKYFWFEADDVPYFKMNTQDI